MNRKVEIVAIPTEDKTEVIINRDLRILSYVATGTATCNEQNHVFENRHLYVTLKGEPIKFGNLYLWKNYIVQAKFIHSTEQSLAWRTRIIASTDINDHLPMISKEFIKAYCEAQGNGTATAQYEHDWETHPECLRTECCQEAKATGCEDICDDGCVASNTFQLVCDRDSTAALKFTSNIDKD